MGRQGSVKGVRALELSLQRWLPTSFLKYAIIPPLASAMIFIY